jgi:hypothetical protein
MEHVFEGHKKSVAKLQGDIISVRTDRFDWMARGRALGPEQPALLVAGRDASALGHTHALVHVRTPTSSFLTHPPSSFVL